jgi:hypothetical protein
MADGLDAFLSLPFAQNLWGRRTHRVSRGSNVDAKCLGRSTMHTLIASLPLPT